MSEPRHARETPDAREASYERDWSPREYLRQYYSSAITEDDAANTRFAVRELRALGRRFASALEFGCGPTVHHVTPLAPFVERITLADYLPANLAEVRSWLDESSGAFDWDTWLTHMLALETGGDRGGLASALFDRKALLRRVITSLRPGDIFQPHPVLGGATFDLVASYYCLECVGVDREAWSACLARLCRTVRPGGVLLLGAVRRAKSYRVFDREFPATFVDETDFARELPRLGFPASMLNVEVASVPEFSEQGFDGVCCVRAVKSGTDRGALE